MNPRRFLPYIVKPVQLLGDLVADAGSPEQVAWGLALGMLVGLVPKGNLTAAALGVVVLATRANLAAAALAAFVFSWIGVLVDPLSHRLGLALLTGLGLRPFWDWLYGLPLVPWMHLHNTVVLGNLLCGLMLLLPAYAVGRWAVRQYGSMAVEAWRRWQLEMTVFVIRLVARWSTR